MAAVRWQGVVSLSGVLNNLFMWRHVTPPMKLVNDTRVVIMVGFTEQIILRVLSSNKHCICFILWNNKLMNITHNFCSHNVKIFGIARNI